MDELHEHVLINRHGDRVRLLNYGARIRSIELAMRHGPREVVLGYLTAEEYLNDPYYMGSTVGRYCNRIARSQFAIDGVLSRLSANNGIHHLHGGKAGFDKRYWTIGQRSNDNSVDFVLLSADGDQGYPGSLLVGVNYAWSDARELRITYSAETDRPTHLNLTNHAYFNLNRTATDILDHRVSINSDSLAQIDSNLLPTGEMFVVAGSALDLRHRKTIGGIVDSGHPLTKLANGADFNYVLREDGVAAELFSSEDDLRMSVETTCPGLQFYCGQHLGPPFRAFGGLCLEPQYFPDSPNQPAFPGTLLMPGERYLETAGYRFQEES